MTALTNNTQAKIDYMAVETVDAHSVFPEFFQPGESKVNRRINRHPDCLQSNANYIPAEKVLRRVLAWWHTPRLKPMGLHGETGTGKTELALYIADRLNEPCYIVKVHPGLMPEDLEGTKDLTASDTGVVTRNMLGLAAKAYRNGGLLLLDEVDKANAATSCSLHGLVEGKPWPIEQFNIVINQHPYFRCMATANTMGEGGHERYHTSNRMDQALRSRFGWLATVFPEPQHELAILEKGYPKLPHKMRKLMVQLANAYRDALLGPDRDGKIDNPINAVFSTRTIVHWAHYTMVFGQKAEWRESLDFAFAGSVDPEYIEECEDITQRILADLANKLVGDVVKECSAVKK
jgi:cobaltochelatase CobS